MRAAAVWAGAGPANGGIPAPNQTPHLSVVAGSDYRVERPPGRAAGNCEPVRMGWASEALIKYGERFLVLGAAVEVPA
jgi:hypothetical protein